MSMVWCWFLMLCPRLSGIRAHHINLWLHKLGGQVLCVGDLACNRRLSHNLSHHVHPITYWGLLT